MLNRQQVEQHSEQLRQTIRQLDDAKRKVFYTHLRQQVRDPDTYASCNFLFIAGLHHFYLKRYARGSFNLAVFLIGIGAFIGGFFGLGLFAIIGICVIELPALFRSQLIVEDYNNQLSEQLLDDLTKHDA
ncbi:TM2 domain-containing protein [Alginatibacterium sediminis]|uniref:TM2 domain-containing protein n=1 Tax=Alginatibacterium sediminis TaxID=2164068 RepID=A0A420E8Y4_9ALTE|nr:TM2 domain-containing protein [Alginatibacterium sediminis]RKF15895.1 TM2 domain-containing protein [Alginatibacterium sediminis]